MPSNEERQARPLSRKARENLRQEGDDEPAEARPREWRRKPTTEGERVGKRRREAQRKQRQRGGEAAVAKAPPRRPKAKGSDRPAEPSGPPPPKRGPRYSRRLLAAIAASGRVAKAIRTAPWRNLEDDEEGAEDEGAGEGPVRDPPAKKPVMGKSKILTAALASVVSATPNRTPKKRIMRAGRIGSAVAAQGKPRGSVGEKLARGLLDSDCESCSGRRRTSHVTAAERATDYVRKVRAAIAAKKAATAAAAAVILTEDEEDGEEVWIEEDEDSDPGHVPLGKKGPDDPPDRAGGLEGRVMTAFSLSMSGTGSVPSLRNPLMEVVLDSGASHNVLPYEVYEKLLAQGRATKLVPVQAPKKFTTASGESLENYGMTELLMIGPGPEGKATKCKCNFHVAAVQRCLLSTARAMDKGNCLVFAKQKASLYMPDGGIVEFLVKGSPRATFKVLPHRQRTA